MASDRGNALGKRAWLVPVKCYCHPPDIRIPALTDVPWLVTNEDTKKEFVSGNRSSADEDHQEVVSQLLADLGYK